MNPNAAARNIFVAALIAARLTAASAAPSMEGARPVEIRLPSRTGADAAHPLRLRFEGRAETPALELPLPAAGAETLDTPEGTVMAYLRHLQAGEAAAVLPFWAAAERAALEPRLDAAWSERSRTFFASLASVRLGGVAIYGPFTLVFLELPLPSGSLSRCYPLLREGRRFYLSNQLTHDLFFSTLGVALAEELSAAAARTTP